MAITVREVGRSRAVSENVDDTGEATLRFWVYGDNDVDAVETAVLAEAPSTFRGLLIDSYEGEAANDTGTEWYFDVKYSTRKVEAGDYRIGFDTTGGTVHITNSLETAKYAASGTAPDLKGAIQLRDGRPEGVDIVIPVLNVNVRATIVDTYVTSAYVQALSNLTGTTNNAPFLGWAAGEVLFLGAQGEFIPNVNLQLTFNFAVSRNASGLSIGDITGVAKSGHDFLWISYKQTEDSGEKKLISRPQYAYVERVYEKSDFGNLYIGVA